MKKYTYMLPLLVFMLMAADTDDAVSKVNTYANYDMKLSFDYPKSWSQVNGQGTEAIVIQPKTEGDRFRENFNVYLVDDKSISLSDFADESLETLEKNHSRFKLESNTKKRKLGKNKFQHLVYTHKTLGYPVTVDWYITTRKNYIYSFVFSSEKDSASNYAATYDEIMASVNLKAKAPKKKKEKKKKEKKTEE